MINIVRYALCRPYSIAALCLLIFCAGLLSYTRLAVDVLPNVNIPSLKIIWTYDGLNAEEMASRMTSSSEIAVMNNVDNVKEVTSKTLNGVAIVQVDFQSKVDIATATAQIVSVSQTITRRMPTGVSPPLIIRYSPSSTPIIQLVVSSNTLNESQLHDYARLQLRSSIQSIGGVRMTLPYGGASRKIMIDMKPEALFSLGLSPTDIIETIGKQNLTLPSGNLREADKEFKITLNASPDSLDEFKSMPITLANGEVIKLQDVANVRDGTSLQTNIARLNGQNAVIVSLIKLGDASTVDIINQLMQKMPDIQKSAPKGVNIHSIFDQSVFVSTAVDHIEKEMLLVGSLVALIILLFLGSWYATLIVLTSIPLSLLNSVFFLYLTGNTLNLMSLGGLALAIGILVDNALVEIENIKRNVAEGMPLQKAIITSANQVAFPEFVSTLSICVVFSPIFMLSGVSGYIFKPIAIVVIASLITSYFLSRTVVPVLASLLLKHEKPAHHSVVGRLHLKIEHVLDGLQARLEGLTTALQRYKIIIPVLFIGILAVTGLSYSHLGQNFFPKTDAGLMRFYIRTPSGMRLEETATQFADIQQEIRTIIPEKELNFVVENIGIPDAPNLAWVSSFVVGSFDGEIQIQLKKGHSATAEYEHKIRQMMKEKFPAMTFTALPADIINQTLSGNTPTAFDLQIAGKDLKGNLQVANTLIERITDIRGAVDVNLEQVLDLPEYSLQIDKERAATLGITTSDIVNEVLSILGYSGSVSSTFWSDRTSGFSYSVQAQSLPKDIHSIGDLMNVTVRSSTTGQQIPLGTLITVIPKKSMATLSRSTLRPVINVLVNDYKTDLGSLYAQIKQVVDEVKPSLKAGNTIDIVGQGHSMQTAYRDLAFGLLIAVFFIYIIMLFNFASWILPFVALSSVPVAIAGGLAGLFATGTPLTVPALMGFIMVIGVSTANSVLVTTFARDVWLSGQCAIQSARIAVGTRLRPVLMTALTMILGLIPMALALGQGSEQNAPLARVVIGGLLFGTVASLVIVPWFFAMVMKRLTRNKPLDNMDELEQDTQEMRG